VGGVEPHRVSKRRSGSTLNKPLFSGTRGRRVDFMKDGLLNLVGKNVKKNEGVQNS